MPADVVLHIYDVGTQNAVSALNVGLRMVGTGAFHAAVEVYDLEWSYGFCDEGSGVFDCRPKGCEMHKYRESVPMGVSQMSSAEVETLLRQLSDEWPGHEYDLLRHNCCSFSDEFCKRLGVGPIPGWVTNLAAAGATLGHTAGAVKSNLDVVGIIAAAKANEVDAKYKITGTATASAQQLFAQVRQLDGQYKVSEGVSRGATTAGQTAATVGGVAVAKASSMGQAALGLVGSMMAPQPKK